LRMCGGACRRIRKKDAPARGGGSGVYGLRHLRPIVEGVYVNGRRRRRQVLRRPVGEGCAVRVRRGVKELVRLIRNAIRSEDDVERTQERTHRLMGDVI
jgi:hypothetical protein